jgi:hypothetical protein
MEPPSRPERFTIPIVEGEFTPNRTLWTLAAPETELLKRPTATERRKAI